MRKNGFTLIELLGGIVILSIIALITIPIISNVINKARLQSLKNSAYGMLDATNLYYAQNEPTKNLRFDIEDNTMTSSDTTKMISYKGNIKDGSLILNKNGKVTICITDGKNSAYKNYTESSVTLVEKQTCYIPDNKSIVYLENDGATRDELSNQELTDLVASMQERIDTLESKNTELENSLNNYYDKTTIDGMTSIVNSKASLDQVYPVGSIYITTTEDTVAKVQAKFGGTWVAYASGRTLVGVDTNDTSFDTIEETGGEKTHTLTTSEMPSHTHTRGTMNITGKVVINHTFKNPGTSLNLENGSINNGETGALSWSGEYDNVNKPYSYRILSNVVTGVSYASGIALNASNSWTGATSSSGSHGHNVTLISVDARPEGFEGETVLPPNVNQLLYIVVGNVRQKSAVVINAELQNALSTLNNSKTLVLEDINNSKTSAIENIANAKNSALDDISHKSDEEIETIGNLLSTAQGYVQQAQNQAQRAQEFANVASNGARKEVKGGFPPKKVVSQCLKRAFKGKHISIYRPKWRFTAFMSRFVGRFFGARFTYKYNKRPHNP